MNTSSPQGAEMAALRAAAQSDIRDLRAKISQLDEASIELLLSRARSHYAWTDKPVRRELLLHIYDITKMGATSMNTCPARFVFVTSKEGKARLTKALKPANVPKVDSAPVTVIVGYDTEFWKELPRLFPHEDRRHLFKDKTQYCEETAFRNSTLQGGYMMAAARALGLDVGAMSGFSNEIVDKEFFAGTTVKSNFLCNLGYADETALFQRLPRFDFDEVCTFA
jgi:3-hydroxypropanoate dehydrogenase